MNTTLARLIANTVRGQRTRVSEGASVKSRPAKSPAFQKRKASGMKHDGCNIRGAVSAGRTLVICCVKTGKNIVMAKVRKTAEEK